MVTSIDALPQKSGNHHINPMEYQSNNVDNFSCVPARCIASLNVLTMTDDSHKIEDMHMLPCIWYLFFAIDFFISYIDLRPYQRGNHEDARSLVVDVSWNMVSFLSSVL